MGRPQRFNPLSVRSLKLEIRPGFGFRGFINFGLTGDNSFCLDSVQFDKMIFDSVPAVLGKFQKGRVSYRCVCTYRRAVAFCGNAAHTHLHRRVFLHNNGDPLQVIEGGFIKIIASRCKQNGIEANLNGLLISCLLYTSPSPRD